MTSSRRWVPRRWSQCSSSSSRVRRARLAQPESGVTYARKIDKTETALDWTRSARELERAIRAFRPAPGAVTQLQGDTLKLWRAGVVDGHGTPGTLLERDSLTIACGEGALRIEDLQRAGGRRVSAAEFLRGRALPPGTRFG
jgi:methionyl-tRNA formyltransferase